MGRLLSLFSLLIIYMVGSIAAEEINSTLPKQLRFLQPEAEVISLKKDEEEGTYSMKIRLPDGLKLAPHKFEKKVRINILSGLFYLGLGNKFDNASLKAFGPGSTLELSPEIAHYAAVKGVTLIEIKGVAPWAVKYVDSVDEKAGSKK